MRVKESQNERAEKEQIVDFLHIDPSKITFTKPKPNKHNGAQIGILYNRKPLFVKYEGFTQFGSREKYDEDGKYQGTSMQINCEGEYLKKAKELDQFFIDYIHSFNDEEIPREVVEGYDEYGQGGSWKRICRKPYIIVNEKRMYTDYPSKMEFNFFYRNDKLFTTFFTWDKEKIETEEIGPRNTVKFIAAWFSITTGNFGATLKPKIIQVTFLEEENIFDKFLLDDDEEEDEEVDYWI